MLRELVVFRETFHDLLGNGPWPSSDKSEMRVLLQLMTVYDLCVKMGRDPECGAFFFWH
jgi:hypothetical protein